MYTVIFWKNHNKGDLDYVHRYICRATHDFIYPKNKNGYYTVIENFDKELLNSDTYRIVFMKKSRRNTTGKTWAVPMFNDKDVENRYYYDSNYSLLTPTKAYWNVTNYKQLLWNGEYNIKDLPCLSIEKDNSKLGNKLFPHKNTQSSNPNIISPILTHNSDQSYRFKNSNNKKIANLECLKNKIDYLYDNLNKQLKILNKQVKAISTRSKPTLGVVASVGCGAQLFSRTSVCASAVVSFSFCCYCLFEYVTKR